MFGKFPGPRGLTPEHFLKVAREHTQKTSHSESVEKKSLLPWPSVKQSSTTDASTTDASATDASATDTSAVDTSPEDESVTDAGEAKHPVHGEAARS